MTAPNDRSELLAAAQAVAANPETAATSPAAASDQPAAKRRVKPATIVASCAVGWAAVAWVWIAQPAWLFGPKGPPALTPAQEIAQQRFAVYLTRGRVEAFRSDSGYYPASIAAVGDSEDGVEYHATSSGYVISSTTGDVHLRLTERTDPGSFLGNSLQLLSRAGQ